MKQAGAVFILFALLLTMQWLVLPDESAAIPAFARRYNLSCSTCHAPIPKLKPYGAEFAGNGFIITENEKERDYVIRRRRAAVAEQDLSHRRSFRCLCGAEIGEQCQRPICNRPGALKLLSGGALAKNIGYYFYFYHERARRSGGHRRRLYPF